MIALVLAGLLLVSGFGLYDHGVIDFTSEAPYVEFDKSQFNNGEHKFGGPDAEESFKDDYEDGQRTP